MVFGRMECILRIAPNITFWQYFLALKVVVPKKQRMNSLPLCVRTYNSLTPCIHVKGKALDEKMI